MHALADLARNVGLVASMSGGRPSDADDGSCSYRRHTDTGHEKRIGTGLHLGQHGEPVGASVDILDEQHSLNLAMRRLAQDARLRDALGSSARELWNNRFRLEQMIEAYRTVIDLASMAPLPSEQTARGFPRTSLPTARKHLRSSGRSAPLDAGFPASPYVDELS